jgi:nitrite reductase/ring-hydroxylating ferredoxin subunit/DMSO/TMAO reductase YedYZ heme-binding membrane subunit
MSASFKPAQWNRNKWFYDAVLVACVALYIEAFEAFAPPFPGGAPIIDAQILNMRAWGSCAFLMLSAILCVGPLARLDPRWLPVLYNRRHFGVIAFCVAFMHAREVLGWYFSFSPTSPPVALLSSNVAYGQWVGFPFESLGLFALLVMATLAFTSHDFWLWFLSPPTWKAIHMCVYAAWFAVVAHVTLGPVLASRNATLAIVVFAAAAGVTTLHALAAVKGKRAAVPAAEDGGGAGWVSLGPARGFFAREGRGATVQLPSGERVAVFCHLGKLSAMSGACAHQNGPLGEGRVVDGLVTCPWHGFQYRLEDGCAPPPFTEKLPTYELRLDGETLRINPRSLGDGARVEPLAGPEAGP